MTSKQDKSGDEPSWLRLEVLTTEADENAARLVELGALGVEVRDGSTYMEDSFAPVPDGKSRLIAYFDADRDIDVLRDMAQDSIVDGEVVSLADYNDRSWETAWMDYFEATPISKRVIVGPPWDSPTTEEHELAIVIEPGMAFGTGTHETTRLCARMLDEILGTRDVETLIDVGCGSAILSMVAAGLGVPRVVGIDIDKTSVEVAKANISKNGFSSDQIELSTRPIENFTERFDVVVANILAPILLRLRDDLLAAVAPGGDLLLSGIPEEQLDEVRTAFGTADFVEVESQRENEWTALHLRHQENS